MACCSRISCSATLTARAAVFHGPPDYGWSVDTTADRCRTNVRERASSNGVPFAKTIAWTTQRRQAKRGATSGVRSAEVTANSTKAATASGGAPTATPKRTRMRRGAWTALRATNASRAIQPGQIDAPCHWHGRWRLRGAALWANCTDVRGGTTQRACNIRPAG